MGMSDREHDIIMWRDLQNQRRSRACGQEPQSGGCLPKFLLAVVVFLGLLLFSWAVWQCRAQAAAGEHRHGDEGFGCVESVGAFGQCS